jgi:hypothetical protein
MCREGESRDRTQQGWALLLLISTQMVNELNGSQAVQQCYNDHFSYTGITAAKNAG